MHRSLLVAPILLLALAACAGDDDAAGQTTSVTVVADDYTFDPDTLTVPAGQVVFTLRNDGAEEHEFEDPAGRPRHRRGRGPHPRP